MNMKLNLLVKILQILTVKFILDLLNLTKDSLNKYFLRFEKYFRNEYRK